MTASFFQPREFSILGFVKGLLSFRSAPAGNGEQQRESQLNMEAAAAGIVLGNRAISPVVGSRLVDISYSDPDPARAQSIADAFADAFVASNLDKRFEANSYAKVFLEDQLHNVESCGWSIRKRRCSTSAKRRRLFKPTIRRQSPKAIWRQPMRRWGRLICGADEETSNCGNSSSRERDQHSAASHQQRH